MGPALQIGIKHCKKEREKESERERKREIECFNLHVHKTSAGVMLIVGYIASTAQPTPRSACNTHNNIVVLVRKTVHRERLSYKYTYHSARTRCQQHSFRKEAHILLCRRKMTKPLGVASVHLNTQMIPCQHCSAYAEERSGPCIAARSFVIVQADHRNPSTTPKSSSGGGAVQKVSSILRIYYAYVYTYIYIYIYMCIYIYIISKRHGR